MRAKIFKELYKKLDTKEAEKDIDCRFICKIREYKDKDALKWMES